MAGSGQAGEEVPFGGGHLLQHPSSAGQRGRGKGNFLSSEYLDYSIASYTFVSIINDYFNLHVSYSAAKDWDFIQILGILIINFS